MSERSAVVVTVSDGVCRGERVDESGPAVGEILARNGFAVESRLVADERREIETLLRELSATASLIVTTGGTGFSVRDVTPEATKAVIEREAPGLAEAMRAAGRASTPFADLSRGVAGVIGSAVVLNLPGSVRGAVESIEAIVAILPHALQHLDGSREHPDVGQ